MRFYINLISAALISVAAASAGTIGLQQYQIGGINGITAAYLADPNANGCATANGCAVSSTPYTGSTGNWQYRSYENSVFNSSTITNQSQNLPNLTGSTTSAASIQDTNITDSNSAPITFDLMNGGGTTNNLNNVWSSTGAGSTSINIPIGIFGADQVWTMLNDYYGFAGQSLTVTFNFSSLSSNDPNATLNTDPNASQLSVVLTEGANGTLRSAMDCTGTTGTGVSCPALTTGASPYNGLAVQSGNPYTSGAANTTSVDGVQVSDSTVWSGSYSSPSGNSPYKSASGAAAPGLAMLDDEDFNFGTAFANDWLVSMTITTSSANALNDSRIALSAVTVEGDPPSVPEPATISLVLGGIGLLGLARLRRA